MTPQQAAIVILTRDAGADVYNAIVGIAELHCILLQPDETMDLKPYLRSLGFEPPEDRTCSLLEIVELASKLFARFAEDIREARERRTIGEPL